jgi:serine/threonine protein kinase
MYKVLEGINYCHSLGIVHIDLKPENIMMEQNGEPRIIDFGLSKNTKGNTRILKSIVGSKLYMAPEILQGDAHGIEADIWSLGIIMF